MLSVLRRTQDSLRLLQQWRPAHGAGAGAESGGAGDGAASAASGGGAGAEAGDVEKIYRQLYLGMCCISCVQPLLLSLPRLFKRTYAHAHSSAISFPLLLQQMCPTLAASCLTSKRMAW